MARDVARDVTRRVHPGLGPAVRRMASPAARRSSARTARAFSIVELAVSLGIFAIIAALISLSIARSLATTTSVRADRVVEQALTTQLTKLSAVEYGSLLDGTFTVPDACPASPAGIGGRSCVTSAAGRLEISYRFQQLDGVSAAAAKCLPNADPSRTASSHGFIGLCATMEKLNGTAATSTTLNFTEQTARVNAPTPGFKTGQGTVRVRVNGDVAQTEGKSLFVVKASSPTNIVGSGQIRNNVAYIQVPQTSPATSCGAATSVAGSGPCTVALSPTNVPNVDSGMVLFGGSLASGPGQSTSVTGTGAGAVTTTLPGASLIASTGHVTDVTVSLAKTSPLRARLLAADGTSQQVNPFPGSVCLWATFVDGPTKRTAPVCNTTSPGTLTLETYQPSWETDPASPVRYAFPPQVPIRLTVDHPDGGCHYAPGMAGYVPGAAAAAPLAADWSPRAVCTSYTWGTPTTGLDDPVVLGENVTRRDIVWSSSAPGSAAVAAAGYASQNLLWAKPRNAPGCSTDATCSSVRPENLENKECPGEYCLSGFNADPTVTSPAGGYHLDTTGPGTYTRAYTVDDPEGDTYDLFARGFETVGSSWSVSTGPTAAGPWTPWPTTDTAFRSGVSGPQTFYVRYTRPTGTDANATLKLNLFAQDSSGAGTLRTLGAKSSSGAVAIAADDVTVEQNGSALVPFTVTSASGAPAASVAVTLTSLDTPLLTGSSATSSAQGSGNLTLYAGSVAAGTYRVRASVGSESTTFTATVVPVAKSLSLTTTGAAQGSSGHADAVVLDATGNPMAGVVVSFTAHRDGKPSTYVYPRTSGCLTAANGSCGVPVAVEPGAPAGAYQVYARSGPTTTPAATFTVTAVPASVTPVNDTLKVIRGASTTYELKVLDRAGAPLPGAAVTHSPSSAITFSPNPATTSAAGVVSISANTTTAAAVGARTITVTVAGRTLTYPLSVVESTYLVTAASPITLPQAGNVTATLRVRNLAGADVVGKTAFLSSSTGRLSVPASAVTSSTGALSVPITALSGTRAGNHQLDILIDDQQYQLNISVTAVASSATFVGQVNQGSTGQPTRVLVFDDAGDPMAGFGISVSANTPTLRFSPSSGTTNADGELAVKVDDTGPTPAGNYTLTVTGAGLSRNIVFGVRQVPKAITVSPAAAATPSSLDLRTGERAHAVATVTDFTGAPVVGTPVEVSGLGDDQTLTSTAERILYANDFTVTDGLNFISGAAASYTIAGDTSAHGATVMRYSSASRSSGWFETASSFAYDPAKTYKVTARVRVKTAPSDGARGVSVGVHAMAADGVTYVNQAGANSRSDQMSGVASNARLLTPADGWVTVSGYVKGTGASAPGEYRDPATPAGLNSAVQRIKPTIVTNHTGGTSGDGGDGVYEVDYLQLAELGSPQKSLPATDELGQIPLDLAAGADGTGWNGQLKFRTSLGAAAAVLDTNVASGLVSNIQDAFTCNGACASDKWYYQLDNVLVDEAAGAGPRYADRWRKAPAGQDPSIRPDSGPGFSRGSRGVVVPDGKSFKAPIPKAACYPGCRSMSMGMWIKPTDKSGLDLSAGLGSASSPGVRLTSNPSTPNQYTVAISDGASTRTGTFDLPAGKGWDTLDGKWTHVAWRVDAALAPGTTASHLWFDGVLVSTQTLPGGALAGDISTNDPLVVGGAQTGAFHGSLDDLAVGYSAWDTATVQNLAQRYQVLATNAARNPNLEGATVTGIWTNNSSLYPMSLDTTAPIEGAKSAMMTRSATSPSTAVTSAYIQGATSSGVGPATTHPVTPGTPVTFSFDVKTEADGRYLNTSMNFYNSAGTRISVGPVSLQQMPAAGTYRHTHTATPPAGTATVSLSVHTFTSPATSPPGPAPLAAAGERVWFDRIMIGAGDYFDGETPDTAQHDYLWVGTPNASYSLKVR